jgi:hypothetical protein
VKRVIQRRAYLLANLPSANISPISHDASFTLVITKSVSCWISELESVAGLDMRPEIYWKLKYLYVLFSLHEICTVEAGERGRGVSSFGENVMDLPEKQAEQRIIIHNSDRASTYLGTLVH